MWSSQLGEIMWKSQNRGQVAMEFVILVAVALTVSTIFFLLNYESRANLAQEREYVALADLAYSLRTELNTATTVSDGYLRIFELPQTIDTRDYNLSIVSDVLVVTGEYTSFSLQIPHVTGSIQKGDNVLKKINGALLLN
jgi:hypothetical protein